MTYVMSDLHGEYDKYIRMLERIDFTDADELYILGDVVDRGEEPVRILYDMSMRANVYPIIGNHDYMAVSLLRRFCVEITEENYATQIDREIMQLLALWQQDGGSTTLAKFRALPQDHRLALIEYMEDFATYACLTVGEKEFILVHGGIPFEKRHLPMEEQNIRELITERMDYTKRYYDNKYIVSGHTPTALIDKAYDGRIMRKNGHIAVDCGAVFGRPLGCIRLDDMAEFYVEQQS